MASDIPVSRLKSLTRLVSFAGLVLLIGTLIPLARALKLPARAVLPFWYHRQCSRILGVQIERRGRQSRQHPTLYVSNHASYLDVTVLGALIRGSFVAKSEVRKWPVFGWLATLQRTVFVERRALRSAVHRDEMVRRLEAGDSLILFAEGTSSDGNRVLPFKSALLSVAEMYRGGAPLMIQPVSVAYTKLDGLPLGRDLRPFFAWYGDMDLMPHLWQFAGLGRLTVVVHFHRPVTLAEVGSRKALSHYCQAESARGVAAAIAGRRLAAADTEVA